MRKLIPVLTFVIVGSVVFAGWANLRGAQEGKPSADDSKSADVKNGKDGKDKPGAAKPKYTIKQVMKVAHKDGLLKKVVGGKATDKERLQLLDLYVAMYEGKPKKGKPESWTKLAGDVVAATAKVVLKHKGAEAKLKEATNCKGCHKPHK